MAATADRLKGATRWSLTARCPRLAYYAFTGVDPVEPDEETQLRFERGHMDERWYVNRLRKKHGKKNVRAQKAVPWPDGGMPLGELHVDAFIVSQRQPVEVKSHLSGPATESDAIQLAGGIRYDIDSGDTGSLVVIPRELGERVYSVTLVDDLGDSEVERNGNVIKVSRAAVENRVQALVDGIHSDTEPERVCRKPSDGRGRMCPFIDHCFFGWEKPELPVVTTERVIELAEQFYRIDQVMKGLKGNRADLTFVAEVLNEYGMDAAIERLQQSRTLNAAEKLLDRVKTELAEAIGSAPEDFLRDPGEYEVGPLVLTRTHVSRKGFEVKPSSYDKWTVRAAPGEEALLSGGDFEVGGDFDFGEEAPF